MKKFIRRKILEEIIITEFQMKNRRLDMLESFKNGIEAMVPVYTRQGDETVVLMENRKKKKFSYSIKTFLRHVYEFCTIDKLAQKNFFRKKGICSNPPLVIDGKVFVKMRVRRPKIKGDSCYGYINIDRIHKVVKLKDGYSIVLKSKQKVDVLDSKETIGKNFIIGMNVKARIEEEK